MIKKSGKNTGFILINKPVGPTSHDVVNILRRIIGIKKIGHAGTLDPFASGLLIMAIGREATREISKFVKLDKEYIATLHLGAVSDTYDRTGKVESVECRVLSDELKREVIIRALEKFIGKQRQVPPMYSAKKVGGKKLYELARKGVQIERKAERIEIYDIKLLKYKWPLVKIKVRCSSGTYIRSLAHDIGKALGCGAYLKELERTAIGKYSVKDAKEIAGMKEDTWNLKLINF